MTYKMLWSVQLSGDPVKINSYNELNRDKVHTVNLITTNSIGLILIGMGLIQPTMAQQTNNKVPEGYEFKVLLKNEHFIPVEKGIKGLEKAIAEKPTEAKVVFDPEGKRKSRIVSYHDTEKCHLKNNGYIFRKRFTLKNGVPERMKVTLKFRGGDIDTVGQKPFIVQSSSALDEPKFEVDVVKESSSSIPIHKFSRSASIKLGKYKTISDLMALYPVLKELESSGHPKIKKPEMKLERVNKGFTAFETVVEVGSVKISEENCNASFSFWYKTKEKTKLIAAEFSYLCEKESDEAIQLFKTILGLSEWVNSNPKYNTKTKIAYGSFCEKSKNGKPGSG